MALVRADPQQSRGSGFAQEGVIDWLSMGPGLIAILGRLSSAGVEFTTVLRGQEICSSIPLGKDGEKFLSDAMSKLRPFSSFGKWIWFGVGVRHILHTLVETAEGGSLVALCAALSEGHTVSTSALILSEMAKRIVSVHDASPSFKQWETLVKVCSSVFSQSTLGLHIHQLLKNGGYMRAAQPEQAGHPQDMAEVLLAVGKVAAGNLKEISIIGGSCCSWIAAFAAQILRLRVSLRSDEGAMIFMNYNGSDYKGQINLQFCNRESTQAIACVGQVYYVRYGDEFIRKCFLGPEGFHSATVESAPFLGEEFHGPRCSLRPSEETLRISLVSQTSPLYLEHIRHILTSLNACSSQERRSLFSTPLKHVGIWISQILYLLL